MKRGVTDRNEIAAHKTSTNPGQCKYRFWEGQCTRPGTQARNEVAMSTERHVRSSRALSESVLTAAV